MTEPNRENIRKWVDALRSGAYRQGRSALKAVTDDGATYCCLGVLEEVSGQRLELDGFNFRTAEGSACQPSRTAIDFVGLSQSVDTDTGDPDLTLSDGSSVTCMYANDTLRMTFDEIADAIERTYLTPERVS